MRFYFSAVVATLSLIIAASYGCKPRIENDLSSAKTLDTASKDGLDVNDVSFLFPLDSNKEPVPAIKATDSLGDGDVWPQDIFDSVIGFAKTQDVTRTQVADRDAWRIFSFRFDPCAPTLDQAVVAARGCSVQLRFIAQPMSNGRDMDFTAHLVYRLGTLNAEKTAFESPGKTTLKSIIEDLQDLKKSSPAKTSGVALGIHPGLATGNQAYAQKVSQFLKKHLSSASLGAVAFMGLDGSAPEPWIFLAGGVLPVTAQGAPILDPANASQAKGRKWFPIDVPTLPKGSKSIMLSFLDSQRVLPMPGGKISTQPLFDRNLKATNPADQQKLGTAFDIDHPDHIHFFNMDCVSCHSTTTRMTNQGIKASFAKNRFKTPKGITGYIATDVIPGNQWNVRNFGYFLGSATVSSRTVTETAAVADFVNKELLGTSNPGLVCPSGSGAEDEVWDCIVLEGTKETECFEKFKCQVAQTNNPPPEPPKPVQPNPPPKIAACDNLGQPGGEFSKDGEVFIMSKADASCFSQKLERSFFGRVSGKFISIDCVSGSECRIGGFKTDQEISGPPAALARGRLLASFRQNLQKNKTLDFKTTPPVFSIRCDQSNCEVKMAKGQKRTGSSGLEPFEPAKPKPQQTKFCGTIRNNIVAGQPQKGGDADLRVVTDNETLILSFPNTLRGRRDRNKANQRQPFKGCVETTGERLQGFEGTVIVVTKLN
jgi:hypothetical protein